jgi:hypothetical protein
MLCSTNFFIVEEGGKNSKLPGEKIDYNERFWWTWDQGRFGFGPYCKFPVRLVSFDESLGVFIRITLKILILAVNLFNR